MTYFLLKITELIIFILYGRKISKASSKPEYWKLSTIPILTFAVVEGLRFGRMVDWNLYYFRYQQLGVNMSYLDYEPLFEFICNFLYQMGVPYYGFIFLQCLFLAASTFVLLENFKSSCVWCVPLILVCTTPNEMFIRWYLAFGFILLSIHTFLNKKYVYTFIWLACSSLCHSGIVVIALMVLILGCLKKYSLPPWISVVLLFLTTFILSLSDVMFIANITSYLSPFMGDWTLGSYIDNASSILDGTWGRVGVMERSLIKNIGAFIAYAPVIFYGKEIMSKYPYGLVFYNLFVIGAIGSPLFTVEIFNRIFSVCLFFFCIVGGIYYSQILKFSKSYSRFVLIISLASLFFALIPHVWDAINRPVDMSLFIWDANGRNYLPF